MENTLFARHHLNPSIPRDPFMYRLVVIQKTKIALFLNFLQKKPCIIF